MIWNEKELNCPQDFVNFIKTCPTKDEARRFMRALVIDDLNARSMIGYLIGYLDSSDQKRLYDWFDTIHPLFGSEELSPEELYNIGLKIGERQKTKDSPNWFAPWFVGALDLKNV